MIDCFTGAIGLSNTETVCNEDGRPVDYNSSLSGLFLDELPGLNNLHDYLCSSKTWDLYNKGQDLGIRYFKGKLNERISKEYSLTRKVSDERIGVTKSIKNVVPVQNYSYVVIEAAPLKNGVIYLDSIGAQFSMTGTVDVELHSSVTGLIDTLTLDTEALKYVETEVNQVLPMYSKGEVIRYYLVHQYTANVPRETSASCGCGGGTPYFNSNKPSYLTKNRTDRDSWMNYMMVGGGEVNSITELEDIGDTNGIYTFGLTLNVRASCVTENAVCTDPMNYNSGLGLLVATGLQLSQGIKIAELLLNLKGISEVNILDQESIASNMVTWMQDLNDNLNSIVDLIEPDEFNCLNCNQKGKITQALMK